MADQNFRVKRGLEVGVGKTILYADPGGDVGIGTDNPSNSLHISRPSALAIRLERTDGAPSYALFQNANNQTIIQNNANGVAFRTGAPPTETMVIDSNGDVGINSTAPTATLDVNGTLNVSGASTFQDNVDLGDGDRLRLGDSNDLEIYHDSSNSYITDSGSGNLLIGSDNDLWITNAAGTENKARFTTNGGVNLYYDNAKKFETTASGIDVTGHTETDTLNVSGLSTFVGDVSFGSTATFGDDDRLRFGDNNEFDIYYSGGRSFIKSGVGQLRIKAASSILLMYENQDGSHLLFIFLKRSITS